MKSIFLKSSNIGLFLALGLFLLSRAGLADGVVTNGTTMKVHSGTYFIESGGRSIQANAVFDIWGNATINGLLSNLGDYNGLIIESDINGTGSLIYNNGNPEATIERYLTDAMWHMVGPPVSNVLTGQYFFNYSPTVWLKDYDEPTDTYNYITSLTLSMPRGKGYAFWVGESKTDVVIEIQGESHASNFILTTSTNPALEFTNLSHGYNLIANPFTSAIDWDNPNWTLTDMEESIWVWDPSTENFKTRNTSQFGDMENGIIPSSQGFFIRTTTSTASITIPTEAKTHNDQALYKSTSAIKSELSYIVLQVFNVNLDSVTDEVWVGFHENASEEFDNGLDISKLMGNETSPQLYLQEDRHLFTIDILPELNGQSRTVALKFRAPEDGAYILNLEEIQYMEGVQIFLEDLKEGSFTNIKENNSIKFNANKDDVDDRFLLHFNPTVTPTHFADNSEPNIYSFNRAVYISLNKEWAKQAKTVLIYDISGRLLYTQKLPAGSFHKIPTAIPQQAIVVKLLFQNQNFTKKLML